MDDFKRVIDNKVNDWIDNPDMCKYLRPETLFSNKFEGYLNENPKLKNDNYTGNDLDIDDLEAELDRIL